MSKQAGFDGTLKIGADTVDTARDVAIAIDDALIDVTARDSGGWRERLAGIGSLALTVNLIYKKGNAGMDALRVATIARTKLSNIKFFFLGGEGFKFDGFVESNGVGQPFEDGDAMDLTIQSTGIVKYLAALS